MRTCVLIISMFFFVSSGYSQSNEAKMKSTAHKLVQFLNNRDTASIVRLHHAFHDSLLSSKGYSESIKPVLKDCDTLRKVITKYGLPKLEGYKIRDGVLGNKEIVIDIFSAEDVALNMRYCRIIVSFYPFYLVVPDKIDNYHLEIGRRQSQKKLIYLPPPERNI